MRYLVSLSLLLLMSSCGLFKKSSDRQNPQLRGTSWVLVSITGFELEKTENPLTLIFSDSNRVGGNSGCNSFGGEYTIKENVKISFGPMMATKRACMPGMQTENQYFNVLRSVDNYVVQNNQLILKKGKNVWAVFSRG